MKRRNFLKLLGLAPAITATDSVVEPTIPKDEYTIESAKAILRKEWGSQYEENISLAKNACRKLCDEGQIQKLANTNLGNNVDIIKYFYKISKTC